MRNRKLRHTGTAIVFVAVMLADTTAMSRPYEIEYAITLDSETIQPVEEEP